MWEKKRKNNLEYIQIYLCTFQPSYICFQHIWISPCQIDIVSPFLLMIKLCTA